MEPLPQKIKRLRTERKLSQDALGKAIGVSRVAVTKWENGDTENLKLSNLKRLCEVFGVEVAELINAKADYVFQDKNGNVFIAEVKKEQRVCEDLSNSYGAAVSAIKKESFSDPDIAAVIALMQATDKAGRSVARVAVKVALDAYRPAQANQAS